ncbi:glycoside hydrolase, family 57 [Leptospira fainei serovar Hurstbridge str. BUT 6]|uniref:Glycoside hydrolase, family 57 n=1 Tax=Leptospira fainei serovar Hurstbridge str. BUT 6 TaxID=1193011 RepID=S3V269_9LEPT|nr:glycoside hydrolase family 57 protein [Leptospira fainei]EPG75488.1 glycoside hydrolase, family 57 [Leptospira fainei serovar Hurstbridge str. BUT 6]
MISVCFYFEVHQPFRLKPYGFFQIGKDDTYFDDEKNSAILRKVAEKCYLPTTQLLLDLIREHKDEFNITFSISGTAIEQFKKWCPVVLDQFKRLADTGNVEFLAETYYHSLSSLFSEREFYRQVQKHRKTIKRELGVLPEAFRNTELIYSNHIGSLVRNMGYSVMLMEGVDRLLDWRSPNFLYKAKYEPGLNLMLKNYRLSDDIAFRFSERSWSAYPLKADKFSNWVHSVAGNGECINLFMDFETFGEHQWADSGIFEFLKQLPSEIKKHPDFKFNTVSRAAENYYPTGDIDTHEPVSWADMERDTSAWLGNSMQRQALEAVYELEDKVYSFGDEELLDTYGKLQTSDHFYYMCTKYFNDGDVHKYFSPYSSPYDAYIYYMNVLQDFRQKLKRKAAVASEKPKVLQEA